MPGPNLIQSIGGTAQKPTRWASIFTSRFFSGLWTNRSLLRGPLGFLYTDFYHAGTTDVLCDGLNSELSIRLTMIRRPGNPQWSSAAALQPFDTFYGFHESTGTILTIGDTATNVDLLTRSSIMSIFAKASGSGQSYFQGVDTSLYIGDGIDLVKYIPGVTNLLIGGNVFNWGGVAPQTAPTLTVVETGSAGVAWQTNTMFTTMGLLNDGTNIQVLSSTMQNGNTTQFGTTGSGAPAFSNVTGGVITDNTCHWNCKGPLTLWTAGATYLSGAPIYDPASNGIYISSGGTESATRPTFNPVFNTHTTSKAGIKWQYIGPPALWKPSTVYNAYWEFPMQMIVEPIIGTSPANMTDIINAGTQLMYVQTNNDATTGSTNDPGTSGSGYTPAWATVSQQTTVDGNNLWVMLNSKNWAPDTEYFGWVAGSTNFSAIIDGNGNFQVALTTGTTQAITPYNGWQASYSFAANSIIAVRNLASATGFTAFKNEGATGTSGSTQPTTWNFTTSATTTDGGITWTSLGATTAGVPVWGQQYGTQTNDGTVTWTNVGTAANSTWATSTIWYLPAAGFAPPSQSQPFGGASVIGSAFNQFVTQSGKSGSGSAPSWITNPNAIPNFVVDNTVTWTSVSPFTALGFTFTKGYGYVYSFKARGVNDAYVTTAPPLQQAGMGSPNIIGPLGPPTGCQDGSVTTSSPVATVIGAQTTGAQIIVSGLGSIDPQFDTIEVYRSTDGFYLGGPYLFLTDLAMPPLNANGQPGTWSIIDFMTDVPEVISGVTLPGLNELIEAPIDHVNDPPPGQYGSLFFTQSNINTPTVAAPGTGLIGVTYHQGRLFGFIGNNVFASGGPDTTVGNGFTAWPPTNVFPFNSNVTRIQSTTSGLLVYTTTDLYIIAGGPAITTYYSQLLVPGLGLLSWNALTLMAGIPYVFAADRQLIGAEPGTGIVRVGHPIGDLLSQFNPMSAYLTYHSYGDLDHALYIGDGATQWFRCDTNLAPDSSYTGPVWSPKCEIAGGIGAIASIETAPGLKQLLISPTAGTNFITQAGDTFTRANENPLSDGGNWTTVVTPLQIVSDMCEPTVINTTCIAEYTGFAFTQNQFCHVEIGNATPGSSSISLFIRYTPSAGNYYELRLLPGGPTVLYKSLASVVTEIATFPSSAAAGDFWTISAAGQTLAVYQNANTLGNVTDASISTGMVGIGLVSVSSLSQTTLVGWSGGAADPQYILTRDSTYNIFSDGGNVGSGEGGGAYESFFTMGNIVLATAGQMAEMGFICADFIQTGSQPTVSVLLDELSATNGAAFEIISNNFVSDPPKLYGPTATPATMWSNRYYFSQTTPGNGGNETPSPAWCKHLQVKCDFGNEDTVQNEMLAFTIWGALWTE